MKYLIQYSFFFLSSSFLFSQITITQNDYTSLYQIGKTNTVFVDTLSESINIGQTGGNNQWDFSNLTPHSFRELSNILTSTTPYADSFANSDMATYFTMDINLGQGQTGKSESWTFYDLTNAAELGSVSLNTFTEDGNTSVNESVSRNFPPFKQYDFPLTFDKTWSVTDSVVDKSFSDGEQYLTGESVTTYNIHIDAWGTMKLPSGKEVDVLRSREQEIKTSFIFGIPMGTDITVTYFFIAKTGESLSILADVEDPPHSGVISGSIGWGNDDLTSVEKLESISNEFYLKQNYPNPFNPSTKIEYSISSPSYVKLIVYDVLGNEVARLVNEFQTSGNYKSEFDGSSLSSGIYLAKLSTDDFFDVKKMILIK
ncbi:MAG: T9SS type A sorting domain-containing protein [Ignavibacteriales bacterium]|nr:T9SS type A sorting domain-containing protein [Ignavibacteriales bacterium]